MYLGFTSTTVANIPPGLLRVRRYKLPPISRYQKFARILESRVFRSPILRSIASYSPTSSHRTNMRPRLIFSRYLLLSFVHVSVLETAVHGRKLGCIFHSPPKSGWSIKKPEDDLVHAKHDGSTWHRSQQVRSQAAVQADQALFLPYKLEALHQACVLQPAICERRLS